MAFDPRYLVSPLWGLSNTYPEQTKSFLTGAKNTLLGEPAHFEQAPSNYEPDQLQARRDILQQGLQGLGTDKIEGAARQGFQKNTVPLLSERFAQYNARGSSGYNNALQDEGNDLEYKLAALRQGNAMNLLNLGLTPTQESRFVPQGQGLLAPLAEGVFDFAKAYATSGASAPGDIMKWFGKRFGGQQSEPFDVVSQGRSPEVLAQQQANRIQNNPLRSLQQMNQQQSGLTPRILQQQGLGQIPQQRQSQFQQEENARKFANMTPTQMLWSGLLNKPLNRTPQQNPSEIYGMYEAPY
jgi:hypothetical protein